MRTGLMYKWSGLCAEWAIEAFGRAVAMDKVQRNHRFLEEALELVQSLGLEREDAHLLVDYVFDRPRGDPAQEVGGVMVTLGTLCVARDLDLASASTNELERAWRDIDKIRAKQKSKPDTGSPIPGRSLTEPVAWNIVHLMQAVHEGRVWEHYHEGKSWYQLHGEIEMDADIRLVQTLMAQGWIDLELDGFISDKPRKVVVNEQA